jgi:Ca2+-binding EF-hand superfamily protein
MLAGVLAAGAAPARPDEPVTDDDVQDLLFLGRSRPLVVRLHLRAGERAAAGRWEEFMGRLFDLLDRDGDDSLDPAEAAHAPTPGQLLQVFAGNFFLAPAAVPRPFPGLDADRDGRVTPEEFRAYYRRHGAGPMALVPPFPPSAQSGALDDALFEALDADHDGRLSRQELARAEEALHPLDRDDDEFIAAAELLPYGPPALAGPLAAPGPEAPTLVVVEREDGSGPPRQRWRAAQRVLVRYDRDGDGKLDRREAGLPRELFDRLDRDGDGRLDEEEAVRYLAEFPDAEGVVTLRPAGALARVDAELANRVPHRAGDGFALKLSAGNLVVGLASLPSLVPFEQIAEGPRRSYAAFFAAADRGGRGYLRRSKLKGPSAAFWSPVFDLAGHDDDERLSLAAVMAVADVIGSGAGAQTQVSLVPAGRGLFALLDADGDGRLSPRELIGVAARLRPFMSDGFVRRDALPQQFHIVLSQGQPDYRALPAGVRGRAMTPRPARAPRGPLWFRKMDRNGDGDVSPREFLGTAEQFRRLDLDGDGLISVEEAEKADRALRLPR